MPLPRTRIGRLDDPASVNIEQRHPASHPHRLTERRPPALPEPTLQTCHVYPRRALPTSAMPAGDALQP